MSKALRDAKCFSPSTACAGADEMAGAAAHDVGLAGLLVDLAQRGRAADRAGLGKPDTARRPAGACRCTTSTICGMTSPARCTTTVSPIAHVLAGDLVLVVQRRVRDDDAADGDGPELGDRRQGAGAPDLDLDRLEHRRRPLGRELVRHRPAGRAGDEAEPLLEREIVDLVDDAVDIVAEARALGFDRAVMGEHLRQPSGRASSADWSAGQSAPSREWPRAGFWRRAR